MGALFAKQKQKPQSRITEQDKAVLQLKQQRDKLKQYQRRIEQSLEKDRELARKCLQTGRKDRARMLLRKKKYQEKLLDTADGQLENLEKLAADLEFAQVELQVLDGLKAGNAALAKVHQILTVDEVERVLDETREAVDKQQEIDALLTGVLTEDDEADVLAELDKLVGITEAEEELEANAAAAAAAAASATPLDDRLPDVPLDELPEAERTKSRPSKRTDRVAVEA